MLEQPWHSTALELLNKGRTKQEVSEIVNRSISQINRFLAAQSVEGVITNPKEKPFGGKARVLVLDIETAPLLLGGWGLFNQNYGLNQIEQDWHIISFAAKWLYEEEVFYHDVVDDKTEEDLLQALWELLHEADFVIAHNGRKFDMKKIRARMIIKGFPPFSPVRVIDTLEITKQNFGFTSNKLEYLTRTLCKKYVKSTHSKFHGYDLWKEFLKGNPEAIEEMRDYNRLDVQSLEELYLILAPWSSKLPNFDLYDEDEIDMSEWMLDGYAYTNLGKYHQYRNLNTGRFMRGRKNLLSKEKREQLLANIIY